jgi:LPXTG-site transpeptidase (sortase) family protein
VPFRPITEVAIPRISLRAAVVPAKLVPKDGGLTWEVPAFKAGHAELSASAGEAGNAVLFGHVVSKRLGNVFKDLEKARVGDRVQVLSEGQEFAYEVVEVRVVGRTDVSVVQPTAIPSLSLITCTGPWLPQVKDYAERLVVRAELINVGPTDAPHPPPGTPPAGAPLAARRTLLEEHFADNRHRWPDDPRGPAWLADDGYHLFTRQPSQFIAIGARLPSSLPEAIVTAIFRKVGGPPGGGYGLIVRDQGPGPRDGINQGDQYYVLETGDRGEFGIWRREGDRWLDLIPWTRSDAVRSGGAANVLTVHTSGQRLTFFVNGQQIASQVDAALTGGTVGVFVGGDFTEAVLEQFIVEVPN